MSLESAWNRIADRIEAEGLGRCVAATPEQLDDLREHVDVEALAPVLARWPEEYVLTIPPLEEVIEKVESLSPGWPRDCLPLDDDSYSMNVVCATAADVRTLSLMAWPESSADVCGERPLASLEAEIAVHALERNGRITIARHLFLGRIDLTMSDEPRWMSDADFARFCREFTPEARERAFVDGASGRERTLVARRLRSALLALLLIGGGVLLLIASIALTPGGLSGRPSLLGAILLIAGGVAPICGLAAVASTASAHHMLRQLRRSFPRA